jgi:hypothetical protein
MSSEREQAIRAQLEDWRSRGLLMLHDDDALHLLAELDAAREENKQLRAYAGAQMFMSDFRTADEMRKALDAAREREKRLREVLEAVVNAWPIPSAQFTAAMMAARVELAREEGTSDGSAVHSPQEG